MDDFIFKVPKLPEDALLNNRRKFNPVRSINGDVNYGFRGENRGSSRASLFDTRGLWSRSDLRPIREGIQVEPAQPSTSRCRTVLQNNSNRMGDFENSFGGFSSCIKENNVDERHNNFMKGSVSDNQQLCVSNSVNLQRMPHFPLGRRVCGNGLNFGSSHINQYDSVISSSLKNSYHEKSDMFRGMNSVNCFQPSQHAGRKNMMESSNSSLSIRKSIFSNDHLPKGCGIQRDYSMNKSKSLFNAFDSRTTASSIQKDPCYMLNASQNLVGHYEVQCKSLMKSMVKMPLMSVKEQIMNRLENLGQALLQTAPELELTFTEAAKDITSILENSVLMNPFSDSSVVPTLSCTSDMIGCPQQGISLLEASRKPSGFMKEPSTVLENLKMGENKNPSFPLMKSFTVELRKGKTITYDDDSLQENTVIENFNSLSKQSDDKKEVNLKNWCPVIKKNGLALIGINDENVKIETEPIKKRINNRRVMLENGAFCNLIGGPSTGNKFPTAILTKIKNGIYGRWRSLATMIAQLNESTQKKSVAVIEKDVAEMTTSGIETSFNATVLTRSKAKYLKISIANSRKGREKQKEIPDSSKTAEITVTSTRGKEEERDKKCKSDETKGKTENSRKKRCHSPLEKSLVKIQKTNSSVKEPEVVKAETDRVLSTTRSGRVVKRPKDIWIGVDLSRNNTIGRPVKSKRVENSKKETEEKQPVKSTKDNEKPETKRVDSTVNHQSEDPCESTIVTKPNRKNKKKVSSKPPFKENVSTNGDDAPWGSGIDGLEDICLPDISIHHDEIISDPKKLKLLSMETPPLKNIRSNLTFLENYTPVQSPDWEVGMAHTRSAVKKFEKLRAQAFKKRIPKEKAMKGKKNMSNKARSNKDVDTVVNWICERGIRSPKKCSNLINYLMPKKNQLEDEEEDSVDEMKDKEEM